MPLLLLLSLLAVPPSTPLPTGRLIDIGGRSIHLSCSGRGQPTVVIDTGLGDFSFDWVLVQERAARVTRVCTYDRAGYAWSDPGPEPRTFDQLIHEIRKALFAAGERAPFVLVGHSFGGGTVRAWALQQPTEVVGLVLAEAVSEHQFIRMGPHAGRLGDGAKGRVIPPPSDDLSTRAAAAPAPPVPTQQVDAPYDRLPKRDQRLHLWASAQASVDTAENSQKEWSTEYYARWAATSQDGTLGSVPLIVLTRAHGGYGDNLDRPAAELEQVRLAAQQGLARLSSSGTQRIVDAGHNLHLEAPDAVAAAIRDVVVAARKRSG